MPIPACASGRQDVIDCVAEMMTSNSKAAGIERQRPHLIDVDHDTWYMMSGTATKETIEVALKSETNWLRASGSMRRTAWGMTMRRRMVKRDIPSDRPASTCPCGID